MVHSLRTRASTANLGRLRRYRRSWLTADLVAGATVAAYLVPQCMAYAELAGLPAVVGLWASLGPLVVYALLGSSRRLSVGPESTTAIMVATAVAPLAAGDPARYAALASALALVVGVICVVAWIARLGFLANLLSRPVLVGYMVGVATLMVVGQIERVTGVAVEGDSLLAEVADLVTHLDEVHVPTLVLASVVLAFLLVLQRWVPRAPGPLLAVAASAAVVAAFGLEQDGIAVVGSVPQGLPVPTLPDVSFDDLVALLAPAVGVALVGYTDNVLTARAFAARDGEVVDADRELLALASANLTSGAVQGMPVSSSGSRTALAEASRAATPAYSLVAAAVVAMVLLAFGGVLATFPTAALGAIVIAAALRLIDRPELVRLRRFRRSEFLLALASTAGVLLFGILVGVGIAVALSILELFTRLMHPHDGVLGEVPGLAGLHDVEDFPDAEQTPGLLVYRYDAPLIFANAEDFHRRAMQAVDDIEASVAPVAWFLLNAEANVEVDITGLDALERLRADLAARGVVLALARVKQDLRVQLERAGLVARIGEEHIFPTLPTARAAFADRPRPDAPS
jgi:high affinity sulfate transporter 1